MNSRFQLLVALLVLPAVLGGCRNHTHTFKYGAHQSVDAAELIQALENIEEGESTVLQDGIWIPLIYYSYTRFQPTSIILEPNFPSEGYSFMRFRGVGPFAFLWASGDTRHYKPDGELYHVGHSWGVLHRLVGHFGHRVWTDRGWFSFRENVWLFGLFGTRGEGFPRRLYPVTAFEVSGGQSGDSPDSPESPESPESPDSPDSPDSP